MREFCDGFWSYQFSRRWRKIARVTGVNFGLAGEIVHQAEPRTGLVGADDSVVKVEASAEIQSQTLDRMPFVLNIDTVKPCRNGPIVHDGRQWYIAELITHCVAARENPFVIVDFRPFPAEIKTGVHRVGISQMIAAVALHTAGPTAAKNSRGRAVVYQISRVIGVKRKCRIAAEAGQLIVELPNRSLPRQHAVIILLKLIFRQVGRGIIGHPKQLVDLRLIGIVGDLKIIDGSPGYKADPLRRGQKIRKITETLPLVGLVMVGAGTRGRRLDSQLTLQVLARYVVIQIALGAADLEAGLKRGVLAPVHIDIAAA